MKNLTIYFDMDGVLADFDRNVKEMSHLYEKPWLQVKEFFRNLLPIGTPDKTISQLKQKGYKVYILTKVEIRDNPLRAMDKKAWLKKYIPSISEDEVIIVPIHREKTEYLRSDIHESILVDDYKGNLIEWQNRGGIAVKFGRYLKSSRPYLQIAETIENLIPLVEELKKD